MWGASGPGGRADDPEPKLPFESQRRSEERPPRQAFRVLVCLFVARLVWTVSSLQAGTVSRSQSQSQNPAQGLGHAGRCSRNIC